jgi:hypothetical protein
MENDFENMNNYKESDPTLSSNEEIIMLLKKQNAVLIKINNNLYSAMESDGDGNIFRSKVLNFNMSIGSMIRFLFKWTIASIPVGIVVAIFYILVIAVISLFVAIPWPSF